jgi:hypothetical protein
MEMFLVMGLFATTSLRLHHALFLSLPPVLPHPSPIWHHPYLQFLISFYDVPILRLPFLLVLLMLMWIIKTSIIIARPLSSRAASQASACFHGSLLPRAASQASACFDDNHLAARQPLPPCINQQLFPCQPCAHPVLQYRRWQEHLWFVRQLKFLPFQGSVPPKKRYRSFVHTAARCIGMKDPRQFDHIMFLLFQGGLLPFGPNPAEKRNRSFIMRVANLSMSSSLGPQFWNLFSPGNASLLLRILWL